MEKQSFVYMLMNDRNTVIYTGVTGNLQKRVFEHKSKTIDGFTKKYNLNKLVYIEEFSYMKEAISREKQIKAGSRKKKLSLIKALNPNFKDLYDEL